MPLTERVARWSAAHAKTVLAAWIALVVGLAVLAGSVGTRALASIDESTGEAHRSAVLLHDSGLAPDAQEAVLITSARHRAGGASAARVAHRVATRLAGLPHVRDVRWRGGDLVARDDRARVVTFALDAGSGGIDEAVTPVLATVDVLDRADDGFRLRQVGDASIEHAVGEMVGEDLGRAETLTLPITLLILVVTFGALVAAGLPLLVGGVSVFAAVSLGALVSHLVPQSEFAPNLVTMLGIALGIDYVLFLLRREREERAAGHPPREALARAAAHSGRAIVISGVTVIVALTGLLISGTGLFVSMGVASMLVVAMVLLGALFVVPALLGLLGDRVERGRLPLRRRGRRGRRGARANGREGRVWGAIARTAVRRPLVATVLCGGVLLAACVPALHMTTADQPAGELPSALAISSTVRAYDRHFPGAPEPARIAVRDHDGHAEARLRGVAATALRRGVTTARGTVARSDDGRTLLLEVPLAGAATRETAEASLARLRALTRAELGGEAAVGGSVAESHDFAATLRDHMPLVFAVVLGSAFLLLACTFRSLVVPVVAVGLNLLSVGAAYGFLTWVFQDGHLTGIIPGAGDGVVISWIPLFLFALLFGLSMDYHVFMLSRIRERVLAGLSTRDAVVGAVRSTGSTITSAALIMVSVFAAFAMGRLAPMQQMGAGLAVAILVDATLVRGVLLPAVMTLLGRANWYAPKVLTRGSAFGRESLAGRPSPTAGGA